MSNTREPLSRRDQLLIESYKEQTAAWRHENNLLYRVTTIILPVSIAALGVPYVRNDVPDLLTTLGGLMLMTFWGLSCQTMQIKSNLRFSVINEIEKCWQIPSHIDCKVRKKDTYGKKTSYVLRSHFLRCGMFWLYLGIVGVLTLFRFYGQCPTEKFFISKTTDFVVIVAVVVIVAPIVGWAMWRAGKEVCAKSKDKTDSPQNDNRK